MKKEKIKMTKLEKKIDFALIISAKKCNPNGDPLIENRPRTDYNSFGEISDVCLKRKIRNRLQNAGENIFIQSQDDAQDDCKSLSERYNKFWNEEKPKSNEVVIKACEKWIDVRTFGQVFAFKKFEKNSNKEETKAKGESKASRGPLSIQTATSIDPVIITTMQIVKSVNSEPSEGKSSDTMGAKHRVEFGLYKTFGSINVDLAEKTGFSYEDAQKIKKALISLFKNDASSARPEGSMEVVKVVWWEHNCASGQYSSAKVHNLLEINKKVDGSPNRPEDYEIKVNSLPNLKGEVLDGE